MTLTRRNHGTGHSYEADGQKLPGVTTILDMTPKPALINWAANVTADYAVDHWAELTELPLSARLKALKGARFQDLDKAARRGTQVHKLAERLAAGTAVEVPEPLRGHVESYLRFLDQFDPDPIAIELVVCNREVGYCGTADLVAHMRGEVWLLDLKTARSGIFPETALQLCAYARAESYTVGEDGEEHPLAELGIQRCAAVHVRADGYDVRPVDSGAVPWAYFQRLAALYYDQEVTRAWVGEALDPPALAS